MIDVLLVQPPFASIEIPSLGLTNLKTTLKKNNINTEIFYSNIKLAKKITPEIYKDITLSSPTKLFGELVFASFAFPSEREKHKKYIDAIRDETVKVTIIGKDKTINDYLNNNNTFFDHLNKQIDDFLDEVSNYIIKKKPKIVGFSSIFQQTCPSIALANKVKELNNDIIIVMGGSNFYSPMGEAILEIANSIDYIFTGEAEVEFLHFCQRIINNEKVVNRVIHCPSVENLEDIPFPDYDDYFEQLNESKIIITDDIKGTPIRNVSFESSRGCWWGEKSHCLFCGLNTCNIKYRQKSFQRIIKELHYLKDKYDAGFINATDCIMPKKLPKIFKKEIDNENRLNNLYYEIKPIYNFEELIILEEVGMHSFQPGLESLNSHLLKLLRKGITAVNNIRFLRDCRTIGIRPDWNILYAIPGERIEDYQMIIDLMPYLFHLTPPLYPSPLYIQRYSPLFNNYKSYNIKNPRPATGYSYVFPDRANLSDLALYFDSDFDTVLKNDLKKQFITIIKEWQNSWKNETPFLHMMKLTDEVMFIYDTRPVSSNKEKIKSITNDHYQILDYLFTPKSIRATESFIQDNNLSSQFNELLKNKYLIQVDNSFLSLVCEPYRKVTFSS